MKKILVPTDFSQASTDATAYAASLARDFSAELLLLNVIVPPIIIEDTSASAYLMTQAEIRENDEQLLEKALKKIHDEYGVKADGFIREGAPAEIIAELSKAKKAGVIVMGMKGRGKSNSIFGSTTTAVIRRSDLPVFVIPEKSRFNPIRRISFASDFDTAEEDYSFLYELADKYQSSIDIINVKKNEEMMSVRDVEGKMEANLSFSKFKHHFQSVKNDSVENGIRDFLEKNTSDILAMVSHRHSFLKRIFGTIHTREMSYRTSLPLLVLPGRN